MSLLAQAPSLYLRRVETNANLLELVMDGSCLTQAYTYCNSTSFPHSAWKDKGVRRGQAGEVSISFLSIVEVDGGFFRLRESSEEDFDADELVNIDEYNAATDPENPDTDGDQMWDGWEVLHGYSPTSAVDAMCDSDGDGVPNVYEFHHGADPRQSTSLPPATLYVDATGDADGDGTKSNPFSEIQTAIDAAGDYDIIQIAQGIYAGARNRNLDFQGKPIMVCSTNGAASCVIDCEGTGRGVYFSRGEDSRTILSGVTIRNGSTNDGAGIRCETSGPTLIDLVIEYNNGVGVNCESSTARLMGCVIQRNTDGGIEFGGVSKDILTNCTIQGNESSGLYCYEQASPTLTDCLVAGNVDAGVECYDTSKLVMRNCSISTNEWCGFYCDGDNQIVLSECRIENNEYEGLSAYSMSVVSLSNCTFRSNELGIDTYSEGAMLAWACHFEDNSYAGISACGTPLDAVNCALVANGNGAEFSGSARITVLNSTFWSNEYSGIVLSSKAGLLVHNGILWDNGDGSLTVYSGSPTVTYSCVEGGWEGEGNISVDPKFQVGGYRLTAGSPCIDAGGPNHVDWDFEGEERWDSPDHTNAASIFDMGADELVDCDGDNMADQWEMAHFGGLQRDGTGDHDEEGGPDGLCDSEEYEKGTDPAKADTDGDGLMDGSECHIHHTDPRGPDTDGDFIYDGGEIGLGLNPLDSSDVTSAYVLADDDADGYQNVYEINHGSDPTNINLVPASTLFVDCANQERGDGSAANPFSIIQDALDESAPYDIIEVADGEYAGAGNHDLDFLGKPIMLIPSGRQGWVVDCGQAGRGFHFHSGEDRRSIIRGATIRNGRAIHGGGIYCVSSSGPTLQNIAIVDCVADSGGGLYAAGATMVLENCVLRKNSAISGGGAAFYDPSTPELVNCTIADNFGGGMECSFSSTPVLQNSIVWGNSRAQILIAGSASPTVTYSCVQGGWPGDGNINPGSFTAGFVRDSYRLKASSHCIDVAAASDVTRDREGDQRWDDPAHANRFSIFDMGADEFVDTDGDGMADVWEMTYFGDLSREGTNDNDAAGGPDGLTDLDEYENQTDPQKRDSDGDSILDSWELESGLDPLRDDAADDPDGDDLSNLVEYQHQTDPLNWDSDGDKLPDAWEVQYDMNPLHFDDIMSVDADMDGLVTFDEYRFTTDPTNPDTDGDGTEDGAEVPASPGSIPNDAEDEGDPANCVTLSLTVGDPSGSWSERWQFELSTQGSPAIKHVNQDFGAPGTKEYALLKGKRYEGRLVWIASNYEHEDYDWQALINGSDETGWCEALYGTGAYYVTDDNNLLTSLTHGDYDNLTIGRVVYIDVPGVDMDIDVPDSEEESEGGFVVVDGDVEAIQLSCGPSSLMSGTLTLQAASGADLINVWADPDKTTPISLPVTWDVTSYPSVLYVEGAAASTSLRDLRLELVYNCPAGSHKDVVTLTILSVEFIDEAPDYSLDSNTDSDNFFLREYDGSGNPDSEDLDIYYRILPEDVPVSDVKIKIYRGDTSTLEATLDGEKDASGDFKTGDNLHTNWTPSVTLADDHPGFYRVQLEVYVDGQTEPICQTSIDDADTSTPGWQCPQDCLAIHDLTWKHRPLVHVHEDEIGSPSSIVEFMVESGDSTGPRVKEWTGGGTPTVHPAGTIPTSINSFWDLFFDDEVTDGDLSDYTASQIAVLTTDSGEETVCHSANTTDANNFAFLQFWMFENFSRRPFGILGMPFNPNVQHEGDMEHCQIAVRLADPSDASLKAKWVTPFGATASQHYYAQTLKWDLNDGSAPANAHSQEHVEHADNRLAIYVALGAHATYLAADADIEVPDINAHLGTQQQYDSNPEGAYDISAPADEIDYELVHVDDILLGTFNGRWGYLLNGNPDSFSNGPSGPPHRAAHDASGNAVNLRTQPKTLHNLSRKTSQATEMEIP